MRGKVLRSFVSRSPKMAASEGDVIDLPDGVDWVRAGFVYVLPDEPRPEIDLAELDVPGVDKKYVNRMKKMVEDASLAPKEKAVTRVKGKGESPKAKGQGQAAAGQGQAAAGQGQAVAPTKKPVRQSKPRTSRTTK